MAARILKDEVIEVIIHHFITLMLLITPFRSTVLGAVKLLCSLAKAHYVDCYAACMRVLIWRLSSRVCLLHVLTSKLAIQFRLIFAIFLCSDFSVFMVSVHLSVFLLAVELLG